MNILFDIAHPADVHLFKNVRSKLISHGHQVWFMARDKDVVIQLLDAYKIPYEKGTKAKRGIIGLSFELVNWFFNAYSLIHKNKIDLAVSLSSPSTAWAAKLQGVPHIMFNDTETGIAQLRMARPATKFIYTPDCLLTDWGPKQIRYKGIHDLAYLREGRRTEDGGRPNRLTDSQTHGNTASRHHGPSELSIHRFTESDYCIIRFVSWGASHDRGHRRTSADFQRKVCQLIEEKMSVYISAEGELPENLEKYRIKIPPHQLHETIANAKLVVGDGATTATEAAVMGIPSLYFSVFADSLGYCHLLKEYGLLASTNDETEAIEIIKKLISEDDFTARQKNRQRLLDETIDVAEFITEKCEEEGKR